MKHLRYFTVLENCANTPNCTGLPSSDDSLAKREYYLAFFIRRRSEQEHNLQPTLANSQQDFKAANGKECQQLQESRKTF